MLEIFEMACRSRRYLDLALGMICLASMAMAQNLVQNPGFETGSFAPWVASSYGALGGPGAGWALRAGTPHSGTKFASTGCNGVLCIAPDSGTGGWLYQDLTTVPGSQYTLTFYYAPGTGVGNAELQVLWGPSATALTTGGAGTCTGSCAFNTTAIGSSSYNQYTVNLTASSSTMRLEFLGRQDPNVSSLDDVVVMPAAPSPTPVPPSLLLTTAGLVCVGLYVGRRRISSVSPPSTHSNCV